MSDYILRNAAYYALKNEADIHKLPASKEAYERAARIVDQMQPEDVQPMKHGEWYPYYRPITDFDGISRRCEKVFICSCCGGSSDKATRYCGNCGADMREEEQE